MWGRWSASLALVACAVASEARAEDPRLTGDVRVWVDGSSGAGLLRLQLQVPEGWHLWTFEPGPGPLPLTVDVPGQPAFAGPWHGPRPKRLYDEGFQRDLDAFEGRVVLERRFDGASLPRSDERRVSVRGQICSERQCLNQRLSLPFTPETDPERADRAPQGSPLAAATGAAAGIEADGPGTRAQATDAPPSSDESPGLALTSAQASFADGQGNGSLGAFLVLAFVFGLGALATPCVFPAIPLTISFFSKYRETGAGRTVALAAVYSATMVVAFAAAGVLASVLFGVTGIQRFAAHPVFNLVLGLALLAFALNLMGLFEIQTPQWLLRGANRLEGLFGRSSERGRSGQGSAFDFVVVAVAALTATTVFFTCTVGFVGVVLVAAARGEILWPTLGMLSFATAFALPFFLLALFPRAARSLQGRGGTWLTSTRVVLGIFELAAATKFLSNADLVWRWGFLSRDVVLSVWVPLFIVGGLFLLGKLKLGEQSAGQEGGSVIRTLASVAMLAFATYLATGLFQGRAFGSWLDGWLPPLRYPGAAASAGPGSHGGLRWTEDLAAARRDAAREGKLLFLNYTGYTCTNCRYMEEAIFPRPEVAELLRQMTLVELYTDGGEPRHETYRQDQVERFDTAALPFYSVETAEGEVLATFESSTNDAKVFRRFLEAAIRKSARRASAAAPVGPG